MSSGKNEIFGKKAAGKNFLKVFPRMVSAKNTLSK
jgi:hypothetical protein